MKRAFKDFFYGNGALRLSKKNRHRLDQISSVLEEYVEDGFTLTLRQLYYQLVSRDIIPNNKGEYKKLSVLLTKARLGGVIDWSAIEDRVRTPKLPHWVKDPTDAIQETIDQYRLNRMKGQEQRIEIWVEKDALSGILYRVSSKYHVRLMVNRGYSSATAMYRASNRLQDGDVILYFGDHDPSGLDMLRDIKSRLQDFEKDVEVVPVALTMKQIKKYNTPPNPAKEDDPRAEWYIKEFGDTSWELDALTPQVLMDLAESEVLKRIDLEKYEAIVKQEGKDRNQIEGLHTLIENEVDPADLKKAIAGINIWTNKKFMKLSEEEQKVRLDYVNQIDAVTGFELLIDIYNSYDVDELENLRNVKR